MLVCVGLNPAIDKVLSAPGFAVGAHAKCRVLSCTAAGKAANVARVLGRLGVPSRLCGFVGAGDADVYRKSFEALPVTADLTPVAKRTRVNTTILDPERKTETHLREAGFHVGPEAFEAFAGRLAASVAPDDMVVFCGSLPPGLEPEAVAGFLRRLCESGCAVGADANGAFLESLKRLPLALLKPNREEMAVLAGCDIPDSGALRTAARRLVAGGSGASAVLASAGPEGAGIFTAEECLWAAPPEADVRSTVGAGDALLAGYLAARAEGLPEAGALCRALACAASAVAQAEAGAVDPEEVQRLAASIRCERVECR